MMRQLVCLGVQLGVAQMRVLEDRRDGVRRAPGLLLEQLMQKTILRIIRRCRVPLDKHFPALGRADERRNLVAFIDVCNHCLKRQDKAISDVVRKIPSVCVLVSDNRNQELR